MIFGPLFRVEMVTVARRRRYFALRVLYGLIALSLLWTAYSTLRLYAYGDEGAISYRQSARLASYFFVSFSWLQILAVLTVGPAMAVGTIATERERRTIEYLFTTDLSNAEIVLGKLTARLCLFGQLLLVGLPILFLFRLLGGIPAQLLVVIFLFAASTSVMIATLSICVSVWSERIRDATVRVYLVLFVLLILPSFSGLPTAWPVLQGPVWDNLIQPVLDFLQAINPIWNLYTALGSQSAIGANLDMQLIWEAVGKQLLVSVAAVGLAIFAVRRVHLKETTQAAARERRRLRLQLPRWKRPLGQNPMLWKEVFAGTAVTKLGIVGRIAMGIILLMVFGGMVAAVIEHFRFRGSNDYHEYLIPLNGFLVSGILLLLAGRAAGLITTEKERDCWLSLLASPLTGREIVRGKMYGNLYSVRWPLLVLLANWGVGVFLAPKFLLTAATLLATFLLLAWYVTNLGLCFSLNSPTTLRAMGVTLGTLVFTSAGYLFCCCVVMSTGRSGGSDFAIFLAPCIPFLSMFPIVAYLEFVQEYNHMLQDGMVAAYLFGMFTYFAVGLSLHLYMTSNFDRLAGRTDTMPDKIAA